MAENRTFLLCVDSAGNSRQQILKGIWNTWLAMLYKETLNSEGPNGQGYYLY